MAKRDPADVAPSDRIEKPSKRSSRRFPIRLVMAGAVVGLTAVVLAWAINGASDDGGTVDTADRSSSPDDEPLVTIDGRSVDPGRLGSAVEAVAASSGRHVSEEAVFIEGAVRLVMSRLINDYGATLVPPPSNEDLLPLMEGAVFEGTFAQSERYSREATTPTTRSVQESIEVLETDPEVRAGYVDLYYHIAGRDAVLAGYSFSEREGRQALAGWLLDEADRRDVRIVSNSTGDLSFASAFEQIKSNLDWVE